MARAHRGGHARDRDRRPRARGARPAAHARAGLPGPEGVPVIVHRVLDDWRVDPLALLPLAAAAAAYLAAARRARRWPLWRSGSFVGGLALLGAIQASGLHRTGEQLLSVHM